LEILKEKTASMMIGRFLADAFICREQSG